MSSQPMLHKYAAMWKVNLKVIITEWNCLLLPAHRLWQLIVFRGVPDAKAHVPSDDTQAPSASVPDPNFGVNNKFIQNYQRSLLLTDGNTETFPTSPSLSMPIVMSFLYHTDQSYNHRYSSSIPAVISFPQLLSYIIPNASDQPASHGTSRIGCLPAKSHISICNKCCVRATCALNHRSDSPVDA